MEEDLEMYGNQLVTSTSIWTVGYVIGQIPSNLLLTRISPRWVIPAVSKAFYSTCSSTTDGEVTAWSWLGDCDCLHLVSTIIQGPLRLAISGGTLRVSIWSANTLYWLRRHDGRLKRNTHCQSSECRLLGGLEISYGRGLKSRIFCWAGRPIFFVRLSRGPRYTDWGLS